MKASVSIAIGSLLLAACANQPKQPSDETPLRHESRAYERQSEPAPSTGASGGDGREDPGRSVPDRDTARREETRAEDTRGKPGSVQPREQSAQATDASAERSDDRGDEPTSERPADEVTPLDQSRTEADIATTRRIRQALMRTDLSFRAKNVMVITQPDRVVLKGKVNSPSEAERVRHIAEAMTTKRIQDLLEVAY